MPVSPQLVFVSYLNVSFMLFLPLPTKTCHLSMEKSAFEEGAVRSSTYAKVSERNIVHHAL